MEINSINDNLEIIDIRSEYEYNTSNIPNSRNIPMYKLLIEPANYLNKSNNYLIVCEYGIQSKIIMNMLNRMGYHTNSLKGGYHSLINNKKVR